MQAKCKIYKYTTTKTLLLIYTFFLSLSHKNFCSILSVSGDNQMEKGARETEFFDRKQVDTLVVVAQLAQREAEDEIKQAADCADVVAKILADSINHVAETLF